MKITRHNKNNSISSLIAILMIGTLVINAIPAHAEYASLKVKILTPLKQSHNGVRSEDIQCMDGLQLIIKSDDSGACVKPSSASKLVQWGWAKRIVDLSSTPEKDESMTKTVSLEDNNQSITLKTGERFLLKLGENYNWEVQIDNSTLVSRVPNIMVIKGAQGTYETHNPGTAELTAMGNPTCLDSYPACKAPSVLFKLQINVLSAETTQNLLISTDKVQYEKGEIVDITIANQGSSRLFPVGWGYTITDSQENHVAPNGVLRMMLVALIPGNSMHWTWDQTDINGTQVNSGMYRITSTYTEESTDKEITSFKDIEIK